MKWGIFAWVLLVAISPASLIGAEKVTGGSDLQRLQGRWVTRAGARHNIVVTLNVDGNKATVDVRTPQGLSVHASGELRINESVEPRAMDWVGFTGLDSQELPDIPAIYQINGATFTVCNGGPSSARPSAFKAGENVLADVHVFERQ